MFMGISRVLQTSQPAASGESHLKSVKQKN
jgi:hypothetical protein